MASECLLSNRRVSQHLASLKHSTFHENYSVLSHIQVSRFFYRIRPTSWSELRAQVSSGLSPSSRKVECLPYLYWSPFESRINRCFPSPYRQSHSQGAPTRIRHSAISPYPIIRRHCLMYALSEMRHNAFASRTIALW